MSASKRFDVVDHRFRLLLGSLLALLLLYPLAELIAYGDAFLQSIAALVLIAGVLSVADHHLVFASAVALAILSIAGDLAVVLGAGRTVLLASLACEAAFELLIDFAILKSVVTARRVTIDTLAGGLCAYLLAGMAFASIYSIVGTLDPGAYAFPDPAPNPAHWVDFAFFSFTTLTTLGYGDIRPVTNFARSLTSVESILGVFYMAILISRLVSVYEEKQVEASA